MMCPCQQSIISLFRSRCMSVYSLRSGSRPNLCQHGIILLSVSGSSLHKQQFNSSWLDRLSCTWCQPLWASRPNCCLHFRPSDGHSTTTAAAFSCGKRQLIQTRKRHNISPIFQNLKSFSSPSEWSGSIISQSL